MNRHVRTTFAVIATLALMMVGIACSVMPEEKIVPRLLQGVTVPARPRRARAPSRPRTLDPRCIGAGPELHSHLRQPGTQHSVSHQTGRQGLRRREGRR